MLSARGISDQEQSSRESEDEREMEFDVVMEEIDRGHCYQDYIRGALELVFVNIYVPSYQRGKRPSCASTAYEFVLLEIWNLDNLK